MKKISNIFALLLVAIGLGSCNNTVENVEEAKGYIQLELSTITSTNTRADASSDYDSKKLLVQIFDAQNNVIKESLWKDGVFTSSEFASPIMLDEGTYTVEAHSANWDGSGSGWNAPYYAGSATVTVKAGHLAKAKLKLTQDNVKVDVFWDQSFRDNFNSATAQISMEDNTAVGGRIFSMTETSSKSAYFPVGNLVWQLHAVNKKNVPHDTSGIIDKVNPRDYFRITFSVAESGTLNPIEIYYDESMNTYTINIKVPRESTISLTANKVTETEANSESGWAQLSGVALGKDMKASDVIMQYKKVSESEWNDIENDKLTISEPTEAGEITYSYKLTMESSPFDYEYRLAYLENGTESATSDSQKFRINGGDALYNGDFELWHDEGSIGYPTESSSVKYWSSSNPASGSAMPALGHMTDKTDDAHTGDYAAKLNAKSAFGFLAAASLYTGSYVEGSMNVSTQTCRINWGVPFNGRPKSLHGYMRYEPGTVDISKGAADGKTPLPSDAPKVGQADHCQIYCALMNIDDPIEVYNGDLSTFPKWETDPRVIAYGALTQKTKQSNWTEFDIELNYHNTTTKPKYLIIVASSCKYGDYFHGSSKSVLYLDDFELKY